MMDLHVMVLHPDAGKALVPLAQALRRKGTAWSVFFTAGGVKTLADADVRAAAQSASVSGVCHHAWDQMMPGQVCPLPLGSQTNNSEMVGKATKVLSL